jgi:hypothetical protein
MIIGSSNFGGGISTRERIGQKSPAFFETLNNFWIDSGAAIPRLDITAKQRLNVSDNLTLPTGLSAPLVVTIDGVTWLFALDSNGYVRYIKPGLHTGQAQQTWSVADTDITGELTSLARMIEVDGKILIPDDGGIKWFEPAWISYVAGKSAWVTGTAYTITTSVVTQSGYAYQCTSSHTASIAGATGTQPGIGDTWTDKWLRLGATRSYLLGMDLPATGTPPDVTQEGDPDPVVVHACDVDWAVATKSTKVTTSISTFYNPTHSGTGLTVNMDDDLPASTKICQVATGTLDLSGKTHLTAWVCGVQGIGPGGLATNSLQFELYSDATCETSIRSLVLPIIEHDWQQVSIALTTPAELTAVKGIGLKTNASWDDGHKRCIRIDDVQATGAAYATQWTDPAVLRDYCYSFAGRSSRINTSPKWYYSGASEVATTPEVLEAGQRIVVACNTGTVRTTCDATHILVWGKDNDATVYEYVGSVDIRNVADSTDVTVYDYGLEGAYDENLDLDQFLDATAIFPSPARFVMDADNCLYAAGMEYSGTTCLNPLDMMHSNINQPWYWGSPDILRVPATLSTAITGLAHWQGNKVVFCDKEFFLLMGEPSSDFYFIRRGSVGCGSNLSIADCGDHGVVWYDGSADFYLYAGALAAAITHSENGRLIDCTKIDLTAAHGGIYWNEHYLFFCTYNSVASVLAFSFATGGWAIHTIPAHAGVGVDSSGAIYGVNFGGYADRWYSGVTGNDLTITGTTAAISYEIETLPIVASATDRERKSTGLLVDMTVPGARNVSALAATIGKRAPSQSVVTKTLATAQTSYDWACVHHGIEWQVGVSGTGANMPTVHYIGVRFSDGDKRR